MPASARRDAARDDPAEAPDPLFDPFRRTVPEAQAQAVPEEVMALVTKRETARRDKQFERSDELRIQIETAGYVLEDTPSGPRIYKR